MDHIGDQLFTRASLTLNQDIDVRSCYLGDLFSYGDHPITRSDHFIYRGFGCLFKVQGLNLLVQSQFFQGQFRDDFNGIRLKRLLNIVVGAQIYGLYD